MSDIHNNPHIHHSGTNRAGDRHGGKKHHEEQTEQGHSETPKAPAAKNVDPSKVLGFLDLQGQLNAGLIQSSQNSNVGPSMASFPTPAAFAKQMEQIKGTIQKEFPGLSGPALEDIAQETLIHLIDPALSTL